MSTVVNNFFSIQDWDSLKPAEQRALYQEANESENIDLVRQLNDLGMRPQVPPFAGPSIVSSLMDVATKYDTILSFLKKLRSSNRLKTRKEFFAPTWREKSPNLSRLLGCDYLTQKIMENQLKHIKIPLKVAVIDEEEAELLEMKGWEQGANIYDINSKQITIYAENVQPVKRKLSRDEVDELIQIIAAARFSDIHRGNIMVAEEGIYFIDTEFKSFAEELHWQDLKRLELLVDEKDKAYFREQIRQRSIEEKMKKRKIEEMNDYYALQQRVRAKKEEAEREVDRQEIAAMENKIHRLEYVGASKVGGHFIKPNTFSFDLQEILASTDID